MKWYRCTKRPSPDEKLIVVVFLSGVFTVLGAVGLVKALLASPEQQEIAAQLAMNSACSLGIGVFIMAVYWFIRRYL